MHRVIVLVFLLSGAFAQASDFHSPRTAALGGAGHAGPLLNDALYLNPSFESFLPSYSASANYGWYNGTSDDSHHGDIINVSLQDGTAEAFQAGLGYTRRPDVHLFTVGASKAFVAKYGVGIGGKFFITRDSSDQKGQDAIASFTFLATDWLQAVAIVDNIVESDLGKQFNFYREFIIGVKVNIDKQLFIYFDPHLVPDLPSTYGHELGVEVTPLSDFFIRLGQFTNAKSSANIYGNGFGVGIGWLFPRASFDYGLERQLSPVGIVNHMLGMTLYL
jgi:hypothetical protein